jgi:hypothetical protein
MIEHGQVLKNEATEEDVEEVEIVDQIHLTEAEVEAIRNRM